MITKTRGVTEGMKANVQATAIVESRLDIRTLAGLLKFFDLNGVKIQNKSMLIREITETLMTSIVSSGMGERIERIEDAYGIMSRLQNARDERVRGNVGRCVAVQVGEEMNKEDMEKKALEYLKEHNVERYNELMERPEFAKYKDACTQLSQEAMQVPDLMIK